ncbi:autophagy-related protein 11-domain-containing protein [Hypoxylon fragiforme]|uniref:autophagy-related protein 11-domain-containing protein n=1 Tax=Hypoxylon fragiforme TaxID=63214 RepID=UPI0020C70DA0|nr:autophagy-related protein 11-domain-containing protein [Hypoxylon fragiforme]KAI2606946.1 autophagy-related protein 11-domain-containing protein [Hypoxylon fragiforme]
MATQTQVLIAHTGQRLQVDISLFTSLDDFKGWVARQSSIPVQNIVALSSQGKTVKIQTIQTEKEIYVYDIRITQASSPGASNSLISELPVPKKYTVFPAPNSIDDTRTLQCWQDLFKSRRDWAMRVVEDSGAMAAAARTRYGEIDVILKCLDAAVANLDTAVKPLYQKHSELKKWATPALDEYATLASNWEQYLELARNVPISSAMVRFMTGQDVRRPRQAALEDLIDPEPTRKAGKLAATSLRKFTNKITELDSTVDKLFAGCDELFQEFNKLIERSVVKHSNDCGQLLEDIEAVALKVDTDYQATLVYTNQAKGLLSASKTAANHTQQLLPTIQKRAYEMDDMLRYATQARNELAADSLAFMRRIAEITSLLQSVRTQINAINNGEEEMTTFDYLRLIQQLPYMYASFVVEALRRKDWSQKVKVDSSTLLNEMAVFQDEELKRRRKWHKMIGSTYGPEETKNNSVLGLEVNLRGDDEAWPETTKQELDEFLTILRRQNADAGVLGDITKLVNELNNPTKQQSKRLKAFKNGSVHEAALGKSALLIRGDDDLLRSLQVDKSKLESKLKTAESRVRRLEDLLHRQTQASRPSPLSNLFQPQQNESTGSVKTSRAPDQRRRSSTSENPEVLHHRIAQLEGDLIAQKERSAMLEQESNAQTEHMKGHLLGNMEALKREFITLKARLEETEDEIEHFGESRENEKLTYDERLHSLQAEVERLSKEKKDDTLRTQGQVEFLRNEARVQRERNVSLERELKEAREKIKELNKRAETTDDCRETQARSLRELHGQLSPMEDPPQDFSDLVDAVATRASDVLAKFRSLEQDVSLMKADLELARSTIKESRSELQVTKERLSREEMSAVHLRETLDKERTRCTTLEREVNDGREQLNQFRVKMTEGETGSESLRKKLEDEEKRVAVLTEQLASKQSQVGSLEEEVRMFQEKLQLSDSTLEGLNNRYEARDGRTKELTQRLYTQNERLCRLLERLGFSVTRSERSMAIQRIPRSERVTQNPNDSSDPGSSIRRSVSLITNSLADSTDLKLLYWMNAEDTNTEDEQYQAFMNGPGNFDIDTFSEIMYRRIKEVEHSTRKMTRDARNYRERAHELAKEARDKIAFRQFKEGDLALFLPTRNQTTGAWAAFNVGCPHFFLREQEGHRLRSREWLVARITRIQERVVDLSKSLQSPAAPPSDGETDSVNTGDENDNPFDLSDGLRWWLIDAHEDKPGAPSTPGLAIADIHAHGRPSKGKSKLGSNGGIEGVSRTLSKSLESRRSSTGSKKALPLGTGKGSALASETNSLRAVVADSPGATSPSPAAEQGAAGPSGTQQEPTEDKGDKGDKGDKRNSVDKSEDNEHRPADESSLLNSPIHFAPRLQQRPSGHLRTYSQPQPRQSQLRREVSATSVESQSPVRRSIVWDSLWNLDVSYPGK